MAELQVLLNDLDSDPSQLLATKLASVTATERTVRATAFVLIPLGLGGVAACAWLLSLYRRRSEATMRAALDTTAQEARTDELTGLPNRRALLEELEQRTNGNRELHADARRPERLQALQRHLRPSRRRRAAEAARPQAGGGLRGPRDRGSARRGRVLRPALRRQCPRTRRTRSADALSEEGEGFRITSASGLAAVPEDARDPSTALRLADTRMYAAKISEHPSDEQEMSVALTRMLDEHHPGLGSHVEDVATWPWPAPRRSTFRRTTSSLVERAAELHDLGKVAHPLGDPDQARVAHRRGMGVHAPPQRHRRAHPRRCPLAGARGVDGALVARALGRQRLSRRACRRGDPDRRSDHLRRRRLLRDDRGAALRPGTIGRERAPGTSRLRGNAVRPRRRHGLPRGARSTGDGGDPRPQALAPVCSRRRPNPSESARSPRTAAPCRAGPSATRPYAAPEQSPVDDGAETPPVPSSRLHQPL